MKEEKRRKGRFDEIFLLELPDAEERREEFVIDEIEDRQGSPRLKSEVTLRLQTEKTDAGYWRDTGMLSVP